MTNRNQTGANDNKTGENRNKKRENRKKTGENRNHKVYKINNGIPLNWLISILILLFFSSRQTAAFVLVKKTYNYNIFK